MESRRVEKVRKEFSKLGISGFLVIEESLEPVFLRYLTGTVVEGILLITQDSSCLVTDDRYIERAKKEAKVDKIIIVSGKSYIETLAEKNILKPGEKIGFDDSLILHSTFRSCQEKIFPQVKFIPASGLIENLSSVKDKKEIAKIKKAIEITETVFEERILPQVKPGISVVDLAAEITYWGKKCGAKKDSFDPIVLTGPHTSLPHGETGEKGYRKKIKLGDIVQFDFGHFYQGYCSDLSRVVVIGKPTEEQKKIHQILLGAQEKAMEAIKPEKIAIDIHKIAENFIQEKGYKFVHGLGHGIGIKIHTKPPISLDEESGKTIIKPGQVFTIEPGIYIEKWGGMRIEDDVLVTKDGCEILTKFPRELIVV